MASYDEIMKGLDLIESPLVKQTVQYMLGNIHNAETDEDYDIAKSAFLMYAASAAPQLLKGDVNVAGALEKSDATEVEKSETVGSAEELLKDVLAEQGIYYFGPLSKHFLHDKRGQYDPHTNSQEEHGNRPGKRELIGYVADVRASAPPEEKKKIPRRVDMLRMSNEQVERVADRVLGNVTTSGDSDPGDAKVLPGGGSMGENTTRSQRRAALRRLGVKKTDESSSDLTKKCKTKKRLGY